MALKRRGDGTQIRPGDMTHQVQIKQDTLTSDGMGGRTGSTAVVATVWANILPLTASRAIVFGIPLTNKPHEIDMVYEDQRYTLDESTVLQVVETGQVLYVHSVVNSDKKYYRHKILATEKK